MQADMQQIRAGQRLLDPAVVDSAAQAPVALALERPLSAEPEPTPENGLGQAPPPALPEGPCPQAFLRDLMDPCTSILRSCVATSPRVSVPVALERAHRDAAVSAGSSSWAALSSSARGNSKQRLVLPRLSRPTAKEMFELAAHLGAGGIRSVVAAGANLGELASVALVSALANPRCSLEVLDLRFNETGSITLVAIACALAANPASRLRLLDLGPSLCLCLCFSLSRARAACLHSCAIGGVS